MEHMILSPAGVKGPAHVPRSSRNYKTKIYAARAATFGTHFLLFKQAFGQDHWETALAQLRAT